MGPLVTTEWLAANLGTPGLVVFDATNARQMAWAVLQAKHARASIFLTSAVDRDSGWDGWQHLVTALGKPLFLSDFDTLKTASGPDGSKR